MKFFFICFLLFFSISPLFSQLTYDYEKLELSASRAHLRFSAFRNNHLFDQIDSIDFYLQPAYDGWIGLNKNDLLTRTAIGLNSYWQKGDFAAGGTFMWSAGEYMKYRQAYINHTFAIPGFSLKENTEAIEGHFINAAVAYSPSSLLSAELGYGRNFIGYGHRSLLMSDFTTNHPYLKLNTQFWKLSYSVLFSAWENSYGVEGIDKLYQSKFSATHFLELKIAKWLYVGVFESLIWQPKADNYNRGFEFHYLNPIIFYRPVEFSIGSPDNAIIGSQLKIQPFKKAYLYGQLLLDEFLLDEIKADIKQWTNPEEDIQSGWWGNKYGLQAGILWLEPLGQTQSSLRLEYNQVRPFTYTHSNPVQAYSHHNLPVAHPYGASFQEMLLEFKMQKQRWLFSIMYNHSLRGEDVFGFNNGSNLELSSNSRVKEYENTTAQGSSTTVDYLEGSVNYVLIPKWQSVLTLGYVFRQAHGFYDQTDEMLYLRFRTDIFRQTLDF
jgi:hypothetical protein